MEDNNANQFQSRAQKPSQHGTFIQFKEECKNRVLVMLAILDELH